MILKNTPILEETEFPEWVNWPLQLSIEEIKDPQRVIDQFFERFCLTDIRACLRDWLFVVYDSKIAAAGYVCLAEDLEQFIEAVFMMQDNEVTQQVYKALNNSC